MMKSFTDGILLKESEHTAWRTLSCDSLDRNVLVMPKPRAASKGSSQAGRIATPRGSIASGWHWPVCPQPSTSWCSRCGFCLCSRCLVGQCPFRETTIVIFFMFCLYKISNIFYLNFKYRFKYFLGSKLIYVQKNCRWTPSTFSLKLRWITTTLTLMFVSTSWIIPLSCWGNLDTRSSYIGKYIALTDKIPLPTGIWLSDCPIIIFSK